MTIKDISTKILARYLEKEIIGRPFIVGIDGLGGSGKTTLASELHQYLLEQCFEVMMLHMDDYIVKKNKRYETGYPEWYEYYYLQWDIEMLRKDLFGSLHNYYSELSLPFYDMQSDSVPTKKIKVNPKAILLVEGIFLQRMEWRKYLDYVVYLDSPYELRMERVLNRDLYIGNYKARLNKYKTRYWLAEDYYVRKLNPDKVADFIIPTIH